MYFEGELNFSIITSKDSFEEDLNKKMGFMPTRVIKKGEWLLINEAPYCIWLYDTSFTNETLAPVLTSFVQRLTQSKASIEDIAKRYEKVIVNMYLRTDYDQFGFSLPNKELQALSQLGLDFDFHFIALGDEEE